MGAVFQKMVLGKKAKPQGRLFAIGDIHGCPDELAAVLKAIAPGPTDTVVFVGDYVDRGPSARDVIDQLVELQRGPAEIVFLKGNHEDMMLSFLGFPGHYGESFIFNGGAQTLDSYGISEDTLERSIEFIPAPHLEFLHNLATSYYRPAVPLRPRWHHARPPTRGAVGRGHALDSPGVHLQPPSD
jgi:hypothetical protein